MFPRLVSKFLPFVPTPIMRKLSSRYIAGETIESAFQRLSKLHGEGFTGALDILGEHVEDEAAARKIADDYIAVGTKMRQAHPELDSYLSIKPTHVGLKLSEDLCFELYEKVLRATRELGLFVRVEMEDHPTVSGTIRVFERLRAAGFENVGIVLQARLFRTAEDIDSLAPGPLDVRVVKGIYLEPEEIAHTRPEPIREAYLAMTRQLLDRGARVALATHDDGMAEDLVKILEEKKVPKERYEFQLLLGVRKFWAERWRDAGHPVRIYVPYGPDWRDYSLRRLKHNPEILGAVMK
ncbi:MAG: proline dehydrogenase family protein, partial [Planctomycetota bacterium]